MKSSVKNVTIAAVWPPSKYYERYFYKKYSQCRCFIPWYSLFPAINDYSSSLMGKKVLVVSHFSETIKKQYLRRELLFDNKLVLLAFDLNNYQPIMSLEG